MAATLADAMYGAAVGDALGVPFEFRERDTFDCVGMVGGGTYGMPAGTWSDDTSLLLATCDSIRVCGGAINTDDMRARFAQWAYQGAYTPHGECFDIGNATAAALAQGVGCTSERSNGNGSLMRIVPLVFVDASDKDIAAVSAITHAHRISIEACVMFVRIAQSVRAGSSLQSAIVKHVVNHEPFERLPYVCDMSRDDIRSTGYVLHTLEAALWCVANTETYKDCVCAAVNLGNDTDTTACVAGALAGIMYGKDAIPAEWMDILQAKETIECCLF